MMFTCRTYSGREAEAMGLANTCFADDAFEGVVTRVARNLAAGFPEVELALGEGYLPWVREVLDAGVALDLTLEESLLRFAEWHALVGVASSVAERFPWAFDVLRAPFTEEPTNWSRRYKANLEKLASGDVIKVSEVVRDLWRRDQEVKSLSAGEKRMLAKARQILVSELALAEKTDEGKASELLDEVLAS